jgi:N-acetylglucosaminyldiphosphoundecaprenol N-acetyl-beta-D-mannosaminyltransferase
MKLFHFEPLDFREVDDFDYKAIAHSINRFSPDVVWVSLGAPKQELFISKLFPEINKGVLFGIGAAINLFLGEHQGIRAPKIMRELHLEWLFRVIKEPKRVGRRAVEYLLLLPRLVLEEIKAKSQNRI